MPFTKHTQSEKTEVVSPQEHEKISEALRREGKTKLSDIDPMDMPVVENDPDTGERLW